MMKFTEGSSEPVSLCILYLHRNVIHLVEWHIICMCIEFFAAYTVAVCVIK